MLDKAVQAESKDSEWGQERNFYLILVIIITFKRTELFKSITESIGKLPVRLHLQRSDWTHHRSTRDHSYFILRMKIWIRYWFFCFISLIHTHHTHSLSGPISHSNPYLSLVSLTECHRAFPWRHAMTWCSPGDAQSGRGPNWRAYSWYQRPFGGATDADRTALCC